MTASEIRIKTVHGSKLIAFGKLVMFHSQDCVAIKSGWDCFGVKYNKPSVNITIRNLTCHGTFSGIAIGSEMSGGVENVTIEKVKFTLANKPVNIKVGNTRGGFVRNVVYRDLIVNGTIEQAIHMDAFHYYNNPNPECPKGWKPPRPVQVSNVSVLGMNGRLANIRGNEVFHFAGLEESPLQNIHLEHIVFQTPNQAVPWNCTTIVNATVLDRTVMPWPPCDEFRRISNVSSSPLDTITYVLWIAILVWVTLFFTWKLYSRPVVNPFLHPWVPK